jgi:hypothetical protein
VEKFLSLEDPSAGPSEGVSKELLSKYGFVSPSKR